MQRSSSLGFSRRPTRIVTRSTTSTNALSPSSQPDSTDPARQSSPSNLKPDNMRINIYGLGYVGSVSAACLAMDGHDVLGIDIDRTKVDCINGGQSAVVEPGLSELLKRAGGAQKLRATPDAVGGAGGSIVCVGTPSNEKGRLFLDYIAPAPTHIGEFLSR